MYEHHLTHTNLFSFLKAHIIKPVLARISSITDATKEKTNGTWKSISCILIMTLTIAVCVLFNEYYLSTLP